MLTPPRSPLPQDLNRPLEADTQDVRFRLEMPEPPPLQVLRLTGVEALNALFRYELELVSLEADLPLEVYVGVPGLLTLRGRHGERDIYGVLEHLQLLEIGRTWTRYQVTFTPSMITLAYRRCSRIFQQLSVPDILLQVIEGAGLPRAYVSNRLHERYAPRTYCVQYQESDLAFFSRLCEEEGISYWFDIVEDELGRHDVVVLGDGAHAIDMLPMPMPMPYHDEAPAATLQEDIVHAFQLSTGLFSGKVSLRDYEFRRPDLSLEVSEADLRFPQLEAYSFPGRYLEPAVGQRIARMSKDNLALETLKLRGITNSRAFRVGFAFELDLHPRLELNQEYQLLRVEYEVTQPQVLGSEAGTGQVQATTWMCKFQAVPLAQPYRPAPATPRPLVHGLQTAEVVGPAGQELYCDEWGRVKVRFPWDRESKGDEYSSCWLRVSHPWAGTGFGGMFLPRVGQEVLVQFLEGDPDRPLIIGRVYNGENPLPYPLPEHASRSTIQTRSTPGGAGYNELRFEDKAGKEEVYLRAEKDHNILVQNKRSTRVGNDSTEHVGHDRFRKVDNEEHVRIGSHRTAVVGGDENVLVEEDRREEVKGNHNRHVGGDELITVHGGDRVISVLGQCEGSGDHITRVHQGDLRQEVAAGDFQVKVQHDHLTEVAEGDHITTLSGAGDHLTSVAGGNMKISLLSGTEGGKLTISACNSILQQTEKDFFLRSKGELLVNSQKSITLNAPDILISASQSLRLQVGPTSITLTPSGLTLDGPTIGSTAIGVNSVAGALVKIN